jgi:hypothetical protein
MEDIMDGAFPKQGYTQSTLALKSGGLGLRNCKTHQRCLHCLIFGHQCLGETDTETRN